MRRTRLSTTVDPELFDSARRVRSGLTDAALIDEALEALLRQHRRAEVDESYRAYDEHPIEAPDEWGDLASFRRAAAAVRGGLPQQVVVDVEVAVHDAAAHSDDQPPRDARMLRSELG